MARGLVSIPVPKAAARVEQQKSRIETQLERRSSSGASEYHDVRCLSLRVIVVAMCTPSACVEFGVECSCVALELCFVSAKYLTARTSYASKFESL